MGVEICKCCGLYYAVTSAVACIVSYLLSKRLKRLGSTKVSSESFKALYGAVLWLIGCVCVYDDVLECV